MSEFIVNHLCYLLHEKEIEQLRKQHEEDYRESNPTAKAVVVLEDSDAERYPAVKQLKADGYHLTDAFAFGYGGEVTGEIQIYTK